MVRVQNYIPLAQGYERLHWASPAASELARLVLCLVDLALRAQRCKLHTCTRGLVYSTASVTRLLAQPGPLPWRSLKNQTSGQDASPSPAPACHTPHRRYLHQALGSEKEFLRQYGPRFRFVLEAVSDATYRERGVSESEVAVTLHK